MLNFDSHTSAGLRFLDDFERLVIDLERGTAVLISFY